MIYVYRIIRKKPVENVKIAGTFPGKNVFDYSKSEAILTYECLAKRKKELFFPLLVPICTHFYINPKEEIKKGK